MPFSECRLGSKPGKTQEFVKFCEQLSKVLWAVTSLHDPM